MKFQNSGNTEKILKGLREKKKKRRTEREGGRGKGGRDGKKERRGRERKEDRGGREREAESKKEGKNEGRVVRFLSHAVKNESQGHKRVK